MPSLNQAAARRTSRSDVRVDASPLEKALAPERVESVLENACGVLHGEIESLGSLIHDLERRVDSVRRPAIEADCGGEAKAEYPACSIATRNVYDATEKVRNLQARVRVLIDHLDT